ncbi:hypothetical protein Dda_1623 [Drechslerella dactyloides]|uniref:Uncharacterized protein n=1 Tax=Drechslerella dactyloides TaxID=74499 RepID=A0AAD6NLK6_DREDA|nr:hypothetical protein Dda_1623 [Drechslerella dactyloides]
MVDHRVSNGYSAKGIIPVAHEATKTMANLAHAGHHLRFMRCRSSLSTKPLRIPRWQQHPDWPASHETIQAARGFIVGCAVSSNPTLLVLGPGRGGLVSGHILRQTLLVLGKPKEKIGVHFVLKWGDVHTNDEGDGPDNITVRGEQPGAIIMLAHGSRDKKKSEMIPRIPTLIIEHKLEDGVSSATTSCTPRERPAVVTTIVLANVICEGLLRKSNLWSPTIDDSMAWLLLVGCEFYKMFLIFANLKYLDTDIPSSFYENTALADMLRTKQKQLQKMDARFKSYTKCSIKLLQWVLNLFWFTPYFDPETSWILLGAALKALTSAGRNDDGSLSLELLTF